MDATRVGWGSPSFQDRYCKSFHGSYGAFYDPQYPPVHTMKCQALDQVYKGLCGSVQAPIVSSSIRSSSSLERKMPRSSVLKSCPSLPLLVFASSFLHSCQLRNNFARGHYTIGKEIVDLVPGRCYEISSVLLLRKYTALSL